MQSCWGPRDLGGQPGVQLGGTSGELGVGVTAFVMRREGRRLCQEGRWRGNGHNTLASPTQREPVSPALETGLGSVRGSCHDRSDISKWDISKSRKSDQACPHGVGTFLPSCEPAQASLLGGGGTQLFRLSPGTLTLMVQTHLRWEHRTQGHLVGRGCGSSLQANSKPTAPPPARSR